MRTWQATARLTAAPNHATAGFAGRQQRHGDGGLREHGGRQRRRDACDPAVRVARPEHPQLPRRVRPQPHIRRHAVRQQRLIPAPLKDVYHVDKHKRWLVIVSGEALTSASSYWKSRKMGESLTQSFPEPDPPFLDTRTCVAHA